jgi:hypothetical protein
MSVATVHPAVAPTVANFVWKDSDIKLLQNTLAEELKTLAGTSPDLYQKLQPFLPEVFFALKNLPSVLKRGYTIELNSRRKRFSSEQALIRLICRLDALKILLLEKSTSQECLLVNQLLHSLISAYCKQLHLESATFLSLPADLDLNEDGCERTLLCAKDREQWVATIRKIEPNKPEYSPIQLSKDRCLLLGPTNEQIDRSCIIATFSVSLKDPRILKIVNEQILKENPIILSDKFSVTFALNYCIGLPQKYPEPNSTTFCGTLHANKEYTLDDSPNDIANPFIEQAKEFASAFFDWRTDEIFETLRSDARQVLTLPLCFPNSVYEFQWMERQLLEEIAKEPDKYIDAIEWLIETAQLTPPDTVAIDETEEVFVTPQKGIEMLLDAHPVPQEVSSNTSIDIRLIQEDTKRRHEVEKRNVSKKSKKPKSHKQPQSSSSSKNNIVLSDKERSQMRHVMQGNSMKVDDFVKFSLSLINKKTGSQDIGLKKALVRMQRHRNNDLQGKVSEQKSFLRTILKS